MVCGTYFWGVLGKGQIAIWPTLPIWIRICLLLASLTSLYCTMLSSSCEQHCSANSSDPPSVATQDVGGNSDNRRMIFIGPYFVISVYFFPKSDTWWWDSPTVILDGFKEQTKGTAPAYLSSQPPTPPPHTHPVLLFETKISSLRRESTEVLIWEGWKLWQPPWGHRRYGFVPGPTKYKMELTSNQKSYF